MIKIALVLVVTLLGLVVLTTATPSPCNSQDTGAEEAHTVLSTSTDDVETQALAPLASIQKIKIPFFFLNSLLGPTNKLIVDGTTFTGSDRKTKCKLCQLECGQLEKSLFEPKSCQYSYFNYGCHLKDYCVSVNNYPTQTEYFAGIALCVKFNGCMLRDKYKKDYHETVKAAPGYETQVAYEKTLRAAREVCRKKFRLGSISYTACVSKILSKSRVSQAMKKQAAAQDNADRRKGNLTRLYKRMIFSITKIPVSFFYTYKMVMDVVDNIKTLDKNTTAQLEFFMTYNAGQDRIPKWFSTNLQVPLLVPKFMQGIIHQIQKEGTTRVQEIGKLFNDYSSQLADNDDSPDNIKIPKQRALLQEVSTKYFALLDKWGKNVEKGGQFYRLIFADPTINYAEQEKQQQKRFNAVKKAKLTKAIKSAKPAKKVTVKKAVKPAKPAKKPVKKVAKPQDVYMCVKKH